MEHIGDLTQRAVTNGTPSSTASPTDLDDAREIARIIVRGMDAHFGRRFRDQWPGVEAWKAAMIEWATSCVRYGPTAVRAAFDAMKADPRVWPPSLPEFLDLVRYQHRPEHRRHVALMKPRSDPVIVAAALAAMRRTLR